MEEKLSVAYILVDSSNLRMEETSNSNYKKWNIYEVVFCDIPIEKRMFSLWIFRVFLQGGSWILPQNCNKCLCLVLQFVHLTNTFTIGFGWEPSTSLQTILDYFDTSFAFSLFIKIYSFIKIYHVNRAYFPQQIVLYYNQ